MKRSELPLNPDGSIYHLAMRPDQAASRCLLVGDPYRVDLAHPFFDKVLHEGQHREFRWITGVYRGQLLSVIGTGIGSDNTEIALLELEALHNIDLSRGLPFPTRKKLHFLRIGTSGLLQSGVPVGAVVFTDWAIGIDPLPFFYEGCADEALSAAFRAYWASCKGDRLPWYGVWSSPSFRAMAEKLEWEGPFVRGGTYSAPGFYGPQGRALVGKVRHPDIPALMAGFTYKSQQIQNIEMEAAALLGLARGLGHEAAALCLGIAQREEGAFAYTNGGPSVEELMRRLLRLGLEWLCRVQ